jgi:hypothetical protein
MELRYIILHDQSKKPYYYIIVDETADRYTVKDIFGATVELGKSNISTIVTLNPYPVGTTVLSKKNEQIGTITKINEHLYNELYTIDTKQASFHLSHDDATPINY